MSAKTAYVKDVSSLLARLARLFVAAYTLIQKRSRPESEVKTLLTTLERFKAGTLTKLPTLPPPPPIPPVSDPGSEVGQRRREFMKRVRDLGHDFVFRELLDELPAFARNKLVNLKRISTFPELLVHLRTVRGYQPFMRYRAWGPTSLDRLERAIVRRGLEPNLTDQEIARIFGVKQKEFAHFVASL